MNVADVKRVLLHILLLAALMLTPGCVSSTRLTPALADTRLRPGDLIEVRFKYYPDLNQAVIITSDGNATLKSVGSLQVGGLTRAGLKSLLQKHYSEVLADPDLTVLIQKASTFTVYVGGRIRRPGLMKYKPDLTVGQGILLAGGFEGQPSRYEIYVFRNFGSEKVKKFKIQLNDVGNEGSNENFKLAPFDVVFVVKASALKDHIGREV